MATFVESIFFRLFRLFVVLSVAKSLYHRHGIPFVVEYKAPLCKGSCHGK